MLVKIVDHHAGEVNSNVGSVLNSAVDVLQHVLVKVLVSIHSLQIFLELLFERKQENFTLRKNEGLRGRTSYLLKKLVVHGQHGRAMSSHVSQMVPKLR